MSNAIVYDSLLVRELARELGRRLAGRRLAAARFDADTTTLLLATSEGDDGDRGIGWRLHPSFGWLRRVHSRSRRTPADLPIGADAVIAGVTAPADERIIVFDIMGFGRVVIELITNRWNAVAVREDGSVHSTLRNLRGARAPRPGQPYAPPEPSRRAGARQPVDRDLWFALLASVAPAEREAALVRGVAYTSGLNAGAILGDAGATQRDTALAAAHARYIEIVSASRVAPCLIDDLRQPYPAPLPGLRSEPCDALLDAFEAAADRLGAAEHDAAAAAGKRQLRKERALAATLRALDRAARKRDRLEVERQGAVPEAARLRHHADLLLSQLHRVGRGDRAVELDDWQGGTVEIELDPALPASENANRLYARARKRERAAASLPKLIARASADAERWAELARRIEAGDADAVREATARFRARVDTTASAEPRALPYRTYRTSGGFEVRVGRGSRSNDDLTFHHSSPDDIWLHARQVGGAHVVLRWNDRQANPPARDLHEAAILAALHSKARTSGTVPVDWTRRKYVRKPRKAKPGLVAVERARTVFVEPDAEVAKRLREA